jgi:hypothetical protein
MGPTAALPMIRGGHQALDWNLGATQATSSKLSQLRADATALLMPSAVQNKSSGKVAAGPVDSDALAAAGLFDARPKGSFHRFESRALFMILRGASPMLRRRRRQTLPLIEQPGLSGRIGVHLGHGSVTARSRLQLLSLETKAGSRPAACARPCAGTDRERRKGPR